jgi:hypothetical protein
MKKKQKKDELTGVQILRAFNNFGKDRKIQVLNWAINYMQQYNGRSKAYCIALATADLLDVKMVEE